MPDHYPPGPPRKPIVGSMLDFRRDRLTFIEHCRDTYGDIAYTRIMDRHVYMLFNAEDIHYMLVKNAQHLIKPPVQRRNLGRLLGDGLLTSDGGYWRQQRKLIQPAFHMQRIASYGDTMVHYTQQTVAQWRNEPEIDAHEAMMHLTMQIVAKALFDAEVTDEADDISRAVTNAIDATSKVLMRPARQLFMWAPTTINQTRREATRTLDAVVYGFIRDRRAAGNPDTGDLLSMLMRATYEDGSTMSEKALRDEIITLFVAGHETTANALTWALYLLAQHPDVYAKATQAVDDTLGGRAAAMADLPALAYIQWIVQESMRLYPPAWVLSRATTAPLTVRGYELPVGAIVLASPWAMHRHPAYWYEPDTFRPERFATHEDKLKAAYFPFGGGPRVCVGNSFAMMEMVLVLATLLQHFCFEMVPGQAIEPEPVVTLRPNTAVRMRMVQRQQQAEPA